MTYVNMVALFCFVCILGLVKREYNSLLHPQGFPGGLYGKEPACHAGDLGSIPGLGRSPREGHGNPLQYSCLENPHGQRSQVGYSPWGPKELDMIEHAHTFYSKFQHWVSGHYIKINKQTQQRSIRIFGPCLPESRIDNFFLI